MKYFIIIFIITILQNFNFSNSKNILGKYSGGSTFVAAELTLQHNGNSIYRHFYDVGGWEKPRYCLWYLKEDTVILNSKWLPELLFVNEIFDSSLKNNIEVSIWGKNEKEYIPFLGSYDLRIDNRLYTSGEYDKIKVKEKIFDQIAKYYFDKDSLNMSPNKIELNMNGSIHLYKIENTTSNKFQMYINCNEDSIFFKSFSTNDKWIMRNDTLFSMFEGEQNKLFYLVKE